MGFMTTITILNDAWDVMEKNKDQFFDNISIGMNGRTRYNREPRRINNFSVGNCSGYMYVAKSHHADDRRLYLIGENLMSTFGYANDDENLEHRKEKLKIAKQILKDEERLIKELEQKQSVK